MIKSFTASTHEIEDADSAVREILSALNDCKNLLKHSVCIISAFSEFADTGVLKAVAEALPFDCIGATTCISACGNEIDQLMLTVTVLTSDDCDFKMLAIPVAEDFDNEINKRIKGMLAHSEDKPALILSYFPLIHTVSGDMMLDSIDKATGGIPLFGTLAVDHTMDYSTTYTIYNGEALPNSIVLCAIYGSPKFSFELASLDENKVQKQKAIITQSSGNILIGVNGKTALEYLEELGLSRNELSRGMGILPLVVDHKDGTKPVARAVFALTPEGYAVCGGAMPENATLGIGRIDDMDITATTDAALRPFIRNEGVLLSYSCMARYLALGAASSAEAEKVREIANGREYLFACSGGEICPLPDGDGKLKNYFHNYTVVFCRLS